MTIPHDHGFPGSDDPANTIHMPRPTPWPMVAALGVTLLCSGLVTNLVMSLLGLVFFILGLWNWVGQLGTASAHIAEPLAPPERRPRPIVALPGQVEELKAGMPGSRLHFPENIHPYSAGIRGGIAGGIAMTIPAFYYGFHSGHGPWYVVNLLACIALPNMETDTVAKLEAFNLTALILGLFIHVTSSILLGLIYGALLPMLPGGRFGAILWGGIVAPLLWTGFFHGWMGVLNPILRQHVNWPSFIAAQFVFGLVVGFVVITSKKVKAERIARDPTQERAAAISEREQS